MTNEFPEGLTVRRPVAEDHARVLAVLDRWWGGFGGEAGSKERALLLPRLFFQHFTTTSFLAERPDGDLAAFLIGFFSQSDPEVAYIHFAGVDPALHGRGVATALYRGFFDQARAQGRRRVHCVTSPGNTASQAFHGRLGFEMLPGDGDVPVQPDYDGPGLDRVVLTLDLDAQPRTGGTLDLDAQPQAGDRDERTRPTLRLTILPTLFSLDHLPDRRHPQDDSWHALVRTPDGLTVIGEASGQTAAADRWIGIYDADAGHGLDVPGLLASVVQPLADSAVPVFVASTYQADLVLAPEPHRDRAIAALRAAGHEITE
ncbi:GNAT family N-acetyltransferase [Nonomuraea zeae]|uniref:GNAT family N-acetyltransferase n=1 Tax=Nonomuraea zeae TaxID=1642303 RepID=UPI001980F459|nr:GNAT family N-acetyltransferase [Nonomuraea zeae]